MTKRWWTVALVSALLGTAVAPAWAATSGTQQQAQITKQISSLQVQIQEVSAQEAGLIKQYNQFQAKVAALDAKVADLDTQVAAAQSRLDQANATVAQLDGRVADAQAQYDQAEVTLRAAGHDLVEEAITAYTAAPEDQLLAAVMHSRDVEDLTTARGYLEALVEGEHDTIGQVKAARAFALAARADLLGKEQDAKAGRDVVATQVAAIASARQAQDQLRNEAAAQQAQQNALVQQAKSKKTQFLAQVTALQAESNSITSLLRGVQKGQPLAPSGHGIFALPIPGAPITSPFGMRFDPILQVYSLHTGVDFGAPMGTPIHAAGDGVVIWAGPRGGYGNCTIIDNGNSLATLYGHQSEIDVHVGQHVSRNQIIGKVGSTGMSTGPHLHFEVRVNGTPVNPLPYL